ncbi:hypothetical protein CQY20_26135 [Mycolicibacterium agri]|uniref:Phage gp6-like head-tail connector protein n=1 Tax=Mycolicibacterium agri TaxID=36811 RepID=A0A2A7MS60_MYCAG|nr:hypothetical protein [Mycolicibacterium agri]PEG34347.1 hypothetical protein CQY20_26135 [Mycolicibacterium agri]GFG49443.1 hypothetical protein MAGR_08840 [Mycolicibacterium agri]
MPWQPPYASAADLAGWLGVEVDPELALATEAASRAIDRACNRQFGQISSSEFRYYTAEWHHDRWLVGIDDLMTDTSLTVEVDNDQDGVPEAEITEYRLTPINAAAIGKPWTAIEILPSSPVKPNGLHHGVRVSARWGWSAVPNAIKLATMIQASRLYERRQNVAGQLREKEVDDVRLQWGLTGGTVELDADVLASVGAYRRVWAAV